ncbi:MAG: ribose-phosphate diphosphokinase [Methanomicrobiales archaeon]|nr:ribose-phosphate diphosphokinase [Methanomicrobiales archaeon]
MRVVSTQKSQILAIGIAKSLGLDFVPTIYSRFPDGEHYLKTGRLDGETIVVGSLTDSDSLVQLLLLLDACEGSECTLVLPYMGYARQDKRFNEGEPISARAIAGALGRMACRVITVHVHEPKILVHFRVDATNVSLGREIGSCLASRGLENPIILAPDGGAVGLARSIGSEGGWETDHLIKTRLSGTEVKIAPKELDVKSREVVIVDDIISTGGTIVQAAMMLREQGASSIHAICVHGVFASNAYSQLKEAGISEILASDTIESGLSKYTAAEGIARAIEGC